MRWIFRYNEQAAKYIGKILKKKMPEPQPWLHIAVKTMSQRNPWAGYAIFVWDTRQVIDEYRSNKGLFTTDMFKIATCGMQRANDNRQPLVGGRKDCNEFFEFGDFDASKSDVFDGKDRVKFTPLYKRRSDKLVPKPGTEAMEYLKPEPCKYKLWDDGAKDPGARQYAWVDAELIGHTDKSLKIRLKDGSVKLARKSANTVRFNGKPKLRPVTDAGLTNEQIHNMYLNYFGDGYEADAARNMSPDDFCEWLRGQD